VTDRARAPIVFAALAVLHTWPLASAPHRLSLHLTDGVPRPLSQVVDFAATFPGCLTLMSRSSGRWNSGPAFGSSPPTAPAIACTGSSRSEVDGAFRHFLISSSI